MTYRPNSLTILEVLQEAGETGATARDISERFTIEDPSRAVADTNVYLHRSRVMGRARRSEVKERTYSPKGRPSKSHRWFITPAGAEYLVPKPLPEVRQLNEPPSARRALELLKEAGEEGMLGSVLARHFTIKDPHMPSQERMSKKSQNLQRRLAWTNQILDRFLLYGYARRGPMEPSPYYHLVPVYRWFVTPEGVDFLAGGMGAGARARRVAAAQRAAATQRARRVRQGELITAAYVKYDPASTYVCERNSAILELRDAGCTLAEIGGVFGITRERARQIISGFKPGVCKCQRCTDAEWFEVGDGVTAGD